MGRSLLVERRGNAALLTLNRPEKRNALSIALRYLLAETLEGLANDPDVRAIGLTGAGPAFCAGMDVTQFGGDLSHKQELVSSSIRAFDQLAQSPKPTVAIVNGAALAGGFALALLCDVRIATEQATFGFPELARGIPPAYAAAAGALPAAVAADLCLTGRTIDAREALALGVVSSIGDGADLLARIADAPPAATAAIKHRIRLHRAGTSPDALLAEEQTALRTALLPPS